MKHIFPQQSVNTYLDDVARAERANGQLAQLQAITDRIQARIRGLCLTPKMKQFLGRDVTFQEFEELMARVRICRATPGNITFHQNIAGMVQSRFQISESAFFQLIQEKDEALEYLDEGAVLEKPSRSRLLRKN